MKCLANRSLSRLHLILIKPSGGSLSNGPSAQTIADWAKTRGYDVTIKACTGEGHAPAGPDRFLAEMFDLFEKTVKE